MVASEALSVNNRHYTLPGIGSYVATASADSDLGNVFIAIRAANTPDGDSMPLMRLRYSGSASIWGFAIYRASHNDYQNSFLPTGHTAGGPEEALDCACGLYLGDPTALIEAITDTPSRGRDRPHGRPPAQIPACAANALGSYLGFWRRSACQGEGAARGRMVSIEKQVDPSDSRYIACAGCGAEAPGANA